MRGSAGWRAAAIVFVAAAVYHLRFVAAGAPGEYLVRHGVFVAVNLAAAAGLWTRPKGFAALFAVLTLQQLYSHGTLAWDLWASRREIDWASVLVLAAMPVLCVLLIQDARMRRDARG